MASGLTLALFAVALAGQASAQSVDAFAPLPLPEPNEVRTASGTPGPRYWQQRADYRMSATLDEQRRSLSGSAEITYSNRSPDPLTFVWLLLDQNVHRPDAAAESIQTVTSPAAAQRQLARAEHYREWQGGFEFDSVTDQRGRALRYRISDTLMRIDLPQPLAPGNSTRLRLTWSYPMPQWGKAGRRAGYECPSAACIFTAGQWFPRVAAYTDYEGWHTQPLLNGGEFTLEFGDYDVTIDVPADHVVAATGMLKNPRQVLTPEQRSRLKQAAVAARPVFVIAPEEARRFDSARRVQGRKRWHFIARNVRDFAFVSAPGLIWDAQGVRQAGAERALVMAMSMYPPQASDSWQRFATRAVVATLKTFGAGLFPYPYATAAVVNTGAMSYSGSEYPMLGVVSGRPASPAADDDKYRVISFIAHEVGHNWAPMLVNSDERQWAWLDEGVTTFLQHRSVLRLAGEHPDELADMDVAEPLYVPVSRIGKTLAAAEQSAIMTPADSLLSSQSAYAKPAAALSVLREAVLGPEVFDASLRDYARAWRFRRPTPADFFRCFEETSGIELTWFWRGWFYSTAAVDLALERVEEVAAAASRGSHVYHISIGNRGGVVMPVLLELRHDDGSRQQVRIPADLWRKNSRNVVWQYVSERRLVGALLDPQELTGDIDVTNNGWPPGEP